MENRELLLSQALALFATRGYDAVGVQEIVTAAGVTKPTLYHYFGSKRGLLEALLAGYFEPFERTLTAAAAYSGDLPLTLTRVTQAYFTFAQTTPTFYRLHLALYMAPPEAEARQVVSPYYMRQHTLLAELFAQAAMHHGNMRGRHARYALALRGMIDSYVLAVLDGYTVFSETLVHELVHQFSHGIYS